MKRAKSAALKQSLCAVAVVLLTSTGVCVTDPTLNLHTTRNGGSMVLDWAGLNAVPYQVQATSALANWTNLSPVLTGTGAALTWSNSFSGQGRLFFRVVRLFPAAAGTASFNPATGLLTVVGDASHTVINIANDGSGVISINGGAMPITGGPATTANTVLIQVLGSPGDDQIALTGTLPPAHLFGAEGNDNLTGGTGSDLLVGGPGSDSLAGKLGNDVIYLDGGDTCTWSPGDGSDLVQGTGSNNTLTFTGANVAEHIALTANGSRLLLTRDVAAITLDVGGVQTVNLNTLGGADTVTVNSLAGTGVTQVNIDLGVGGTGDGAVDVVAINDTPAADTFNVTANAGALEITGSGPLVRISNAEPANDVISFIGVGGDIVNVNGTAGADTMQVAPSPVAGTVRTTVAGFTAPIDVTGALTLAVNGLGGSDTITASGSLAVLGIPLRFDAGDGDDTITGSNGNDTIIAGAGNDVIVGGQGNDVIHLGSGTDTCLWSPGDGSDTIDGQGGNNTLTFTGANVAENIALTANGSRLLLTRDVAAITLDVGGVQTINVNALGGSDKVTINNLAGTGITQVNVDLGSGGTGDSAADIVTVNGTPSPDAIDITANAGLAVVTGLAAQLQINHAESANDQLIVNGQGGTDTFFIGPGVSSLIQVTTNQ